MITSIWSWIATQTGLTEGVDLLVGHRPQSAKDRCSVVMETGGGGIDVNLVDRVDKMIQIITRAKTYFTAHDDAIAIYDAIYRNHQLGSAGWEIPAVAPATQDFVAMSIEPVSDPTYIGQDEKGRYEFSCNYIFRMRHK